MGSRSAILFNSLRIFDETYFSTQRAASAPHPRLPRPHADEERPHRAQATPSKRPEAADCLNSVKLRRRAEYLKVYERGTRLRGRFMTCFALPNDVGSPRLGIAASQKIGNAVTRNRAKRLVRELFRGHKPLTGIDIVVIPRREMLEASWQKIEADYCAALQRIEKL